MPQKCPTCLQTFPVFMRVFKTTIINSWKSDHIPDLPASNFFHTLQFSLHSYLLCRHNILCTRNVYHHTYTSNLHIHFLCVAPASTILLTSAKSSKTLCPLFSHAIIARFITFSKYLQIFYTLLLLNHSYKTPIN